MGNLLRMDLYRMTKAKSFIVCLAVSFLLALSSTPLEKLLYMIGNTIAPGEAGEFPATADLAGMIRSPLSSLMIMLALLSIVSFFYADMENGYIKNIAGQMPKKGFSILSRFLAAIPHNLVFMFACIAGNIIGTLLFKRITADGPILESIGIFLLKFLLLQSICAILLLFAASLRNKSLGIVFAVLLGLPVMGLIYLGINSGLEQLIGKDFSIIPYMPDQVLREEKPEWIRGLLVSAVTTGIFLPLAIRIFDIKDVK